MSVLLPESQLQLLVLLMIVANCLTFIPGRRHFQLYDYHYTLTTLTAGKIDENLLSPSLYLLTLPSAALCCLLYLPSVCSTRPPTSIKFQFVLEVGKLLFAAVYKLGRLGLCCEGSLVAGGETVPRWPPSAAVHITNIPKLVNYTRE